MSRRGKGGEYAVGNDCPCGRGPGHIRIKAAGCTPNAETPIVASPWPEDEPLGEPPPWPILPRGGDDA